MKIGPPLLPTRPPAAPQPPMSLREWYAGMALQGILGNRSWNTLALAEQGLSDEQAFGIAARTAFRYADAMLAQAAKGRP